MFSSKQMTPEEEEQAKQFDELLDDEAIEVFCEKIDEAFDEVAGDNVSTSAFVKKLFEGMNTQSEDER